MNDQTFGYLPTVLKAKHGEDVTIKDVTRNNAVKGFHVTLPNDYVVSVQCGAGNYCSHYHADFDEAVGVMSSLTAEIAYWKRNGEMLRFDDGDTVQGYKTLSEVVDFINHVMELKQWTTYLMMLNLFSSFRSFAVQVNVMNRWSLVKPRIVAR